MKNTQNILVRWTDGWSIYVWVGGKLSYIRAYNGEADVLTYHGPLSMFTHYLRHILTHCGKHKGKVKKFKPYVLPVKTLLRIAG